MKMLQKQQVMDAIAEFNAADFEAAFKRKYKNSESLNSVVVNEFTVEELISLARLAMRKLEAFLENPGWKILPCDNVNMSAYARVTLPSVIGAITKHFQSAAYAQTVGTVKLLVSFEMRFGIWLYQSVATEERETQLEALESKVKVMMARASDSVNEVETLIDNLKTQIANAGAIVDSGRTEMNQVEVLREKMNSIYDSMKRVKNEVHGYQNEIVSICDKLTKDSDDIHYSKEMMDGYANEFHSNLSEAKSCLKTLVDETKNQIKDIQLHHDKVSDCYAEAQKLVNYIKDGTLAHSFNNRKNSIQNQVTFWKWLSVAGTILLAVWIYVVFTVLNVNIPGMDASKVSGFIVFANLMLNIAKTSPMVVLLWFILAQYKKERHLLEEYAFREAVALTLTSYLNQLGESQDVQQRTLLMRTVERLYTQPVMVGDSSIAISLKSGDILKTVRAVTDATKESEGV